MILIKLGGSVITRKDEYRTFRKETMDRLAGEVSRSEQQVILVHGAGSYGHMTASEYNLQDGMKDRTQIPGFCEVMADVRELNLKVLRAMNAQGLPASSIPPSSCAELDHGELVSLDTERFQQYLDIGITPTTFGDVVLDRTRGFGICSGDQLIEFLAREFDPDKVVFCSDVDGIFTSDPSENPDAAMIRELSWGILDELPKTEKYVDVTGSVFAKIESMLNLAPFCGECIIINGNAEGRLEALLEGKDVIGSIVLDGRSDEENRTEES